MKGTIYYNLIYQIKFVTYLADDIKILGALK